VFIKLRQIKPNRLHIKLNDHKIVGERIEVKLEIKKYRNLIKPTSFYLFMKEE
jgi:hypothetical protein